MSYILFATSGGGLATPVSIANGGTGETVAAAALEALSTIPFANSGQNTDWGTVLVDAPILPADLDNVADVVDQLLQALQGIGVLG